MTNKPSIQDMRTFCKDKGFVYKNSSIYGGLSGFFDYGPLGTELKKNIKDNWWKTFVKDRSDVVGLDGSIITDKQVWEASGHATEFNDVFVECTNCSKRIRADKYIEEELGTNVEGFSPDEISEFIEDNDLTCPECNSYFGDPTPFNLMFETHIGPKSEGDDSLAYLRPETAQLIFTNFKNIVDTSRVKVPFGIAQTGTAFRNEISPRNFLFRTREFEQMEIEFFTHPDKVDDCPYFDEVSSLEINYLSSSAQEDNESYSTVSMSELVEDDELSEWHAYWLGLNYEWFLELGISEDKLRIREHLSDEMAHYSEACFDIEYEFPFGWEEIYGNADRGCYDLKQHDDYSDESLKVYDQSNEEKYLPVVASEPSHGLDRNFLAFLYDSFKDDEDRGNIVLSLDPRIAPIKVAVFPLVTNEDDLMNKAENVYDEIKEAFNTRFDDSGSIGKRYARADEVGIPLCITVDFDTLDDDTVTIRDRDSSEQIRVKISDLKSKVFEFIQGSNFESLGEKV